MPSGSRQRRNHRVVRAMLCSVRDPCHPADIVNAMTISERNLLNLHGAFGAQEMIDPSMALKSNALFTDLFSWRRAKT